MSVIGEDGLVIPRKLRNPCLESPASRDINRQIKWNAKTGVNVLSKTELEKALDRQRRLQVEREREEEREEEETPFDKVLKERAKRLEQIELEGSCDDVCQLDDDRTNQPVSERTNIFETAATKKSDHIKDTVSPKCWRQNQTTKPVSGKQQVKQCPVTAVTNLPPGCHNKELETRLRASKTQHQTSDQTFKGSTQLLSPGINTNSCTNNRNGANKNSCGNSSCDSSKSSSPEPELFKVFAQLRTHKDDEEYM